MRTLSGPATWLADIYTPRTPGPHPVEPAGLVACLMLLMAVLALTGAVLH